MKKNQSPNSLDFFDVDFNLPINCILKGLVIKLIWLIPQTNDFSSKLILPYRNYYLGLQIAFHFPLLCQLSYSQVIHKSFLEGLQLHHWWYTSNFSSKWILFLQSLSSKLPSNCGIGEFGIPITFSVTSFSLRWFHRGKMILFCQNMIEIKIKSNHRLARL